MRTLQIKKLSIAPAGSEEGVIMEQYQYLHQKKMQKQKQPVAIVDLTSAGITRQCYAFPIAVPNKISICPIDKCRKGKVVSIHTMMTHEGAEVYFHFFSTMALYPC
jgi:hypothetical protein